MTVYFVIQEEIHDAETLKTYAEKAREARTNGRVLAIDNDADVLEGDWHGDRVVIIEFDDEAAFRAWYESPAYQEALKLRLAATDSRSALVHGMDPA